MDLRGNPGGLYDQAQKVADAFIDSGVLVSMVGVGGSQRKDEHASRNGNVKVPLAVLVNQLSASASRDRRRRGEEPGPRRGHRRDHLRQGVGADAVRHPLAGVHQRQGRRRPAGPEADHRPVPDPGRPVHPGRGRDPRRGPGAPAGPEERRREHHPAAAVEPPPAGVGLRVAPGSPERPEGGQAGRDAVLPVRAPARAGEARAGQPRRTRTTTRTRPSRSRRTRRRTWRRWRRT